MSNRRRKSSNVPGQYLGYSLQLMRVLSRLLEAEEGDVISLELFDDVGVDKRNGHKIAEQGKSTLNGNPVSDRAVDLWKTFSNWVEYVESGVLKIDKTKFDIYVSRPKDGDIVNAFTKAVTQAEAKAALTSAKTKLWGPPPKNALKPHLPKTISPFVNHVLEADEGIVCKIIQSFSLLCGEGCSHESLKTLLTKKLVHKDIVDTVILYALGWLKVKTDSLLEKKQAAIVSYEEFHRELTSFVRKADRRQLLVSFAPAPQKSEIHADLTRARNYVRQLELIESAESDIIRAISDYLRASKDRTVWGVMGHVNHTSFDEFEEDLQRIWQNLEKQGKIRYGHLSDEDKGKMLYLECSQYKGKLEGLDVPSHFTPGSFHALADVPSLGWHPNYKNKLKGPASKSSKKRK